MSAEYRLTLHFGSGEVSHVVERDRLVVKYEKTARTESIPFDAIREINLRQEMHGVYTTYIKRSSGKTLMIPSRHFKALGVFDDRLGEYVPFVRSLIEACGKASTSTKITAGSSILYALGWLLLLAGIGFTLAVALASLSRGLPPLRMLFVLPVTFLVGLGFVRQGRARAIDAASIPPEVLPA